MTTGINTGYYNNYYRQNYQNWVNSPYLVNQTSAGNINFTSQNQQVTAKKDNTADGKDDGSIGFFGAAKNLLKGAWNFIKSPFTDKEGNFSLWETLKTVAIGAAICFIPGAPAIALAVGGAMGVFGAAKAGYNIATAKTDAEAEAAWQSMGASATQIAASAYGAKKFGQFKTGNTNAGYIDGFKAVKADIMETKTALGNESIGSLYSKGADKLASIKDGAKSAYDAVKGEYKWRNASTDVKARYLRLHNEKFANLSPEAQARYIRMYGNKIPSPQAQELYGVARTATQGTRTNLNQTLSSLKDVQLKDLGAKIVEIAKNQYKNVRNAEPGAYTPSSNNQAIIFGTAALTGRNTFQAPFYSQLTAAERQYFDTLPQDQKDALVKQYNAAVA